MTLFLVGSGPSDSLHEVHELFVQEARRRGGRIGVALLGNAATTGELLDSYTAPILARWPEAEIVPIFLDDETPDTTAAFTGGGTQWPDDFSNLAALVVGGGWTPGYLEALAQRRDEISHLVRGGMPYLGYSAGAVIVSRHAVVGGWQLHGRQVAPEITGEGTDELTISDGLALIGPCVVTHADTWSTLGLALAALEVCDARTAVTIDEGTCLLVNPVTGRTAVSGSGRLYWLQRDGDRVEVSHEEEPHLAPAPVVPTPIPEADESNPVKPSQLPRHVPPHPAEAGDQESDPAEASPTEPSPTEPGTTEPGTTEPVDAQVSDPDTAASPEPAAQTPVPTDQ